MGSIGKCGVKRESIVLDQKAEGSWFVPIVELASLFSKVLSNFYRNLAIGHLVNCFDTDDAPTESFIRETFFEIAPCLAGAKDQNQFCVAKMRHHRVIVSVEMATELSVPLILCLQTEKSYATLSGRRTLRSRSTRSSRYDIFAR